jgi:hypothetical protein
MYRGKCSFAIGQKSPTTRVVSLTPLQNGGFSSQANHRAMFPFPMIIKTRNFAESNDSVSEQRLSPPRTVLTATRTDGTSSLLSLQLMSRTLFKL